MRKIVPRSVLYMFIFCLKNFEHEKAIFEPLQFESYWKIPEIRKNKSHCLFGPAHRPAPLSHAPQGCQVTARISASSAAGHLPPAAHARRLEPIPTPLRYKSSKEPRPVFFSSPPVNALSRHWGHSKELVFDSSLRSLPSSTEQSGGCALAPPWSSTSPLILSLLESLGFSLSPSLAPLLRRRSLLGKRCRQPPFSAILSA
jgi:hypothetical protein